MAEEARLTDPPINASMLDHAARVVANTLERAKRGELSAQRDLLRYAVADALEACLVRIAALADRCAPTLDELKINERQFSYDAQQLRFEIERVGNVLNQAAGRAVVIELPEREEEIAGGAS